MTKRLLTLLLTLCLALPLPVAWAQEIAVTDMMGRQVTLDGPAQRVIALDAADCEILCALGAEEALVGRGAYCNYPEGVLDKPTVDSGAQTNLEAILALSPDVVIMSTMAQTTQQVEALENAGVQVVTTNAQTIAGTYQAIELLGQVTGRQAQAQALVGQMQSAFADIAAQAADRGKTVYFEVSPLQYGLWTAGTGSFMDELAQLCGLRNAFADVTGSWVEISQEQVLARDPDYIVTITAYAGEGPTPVEEIAARPGWENVTAVQNGAIFNADSDAISRPGPRLVDAAQALFAFVSAMEGGAQ